MRDPLSITPAKVATEKQFTELVEQVVAYLILRIEPYNTMLFDLFLQFLFGSRWHVLITQKPLLFDLIVTLVE